MTHCIAASVVCSSLSIFGSATFTTDSSTNASVDPSTAATSTHRCCAAHAGLRGAARIATVSQGNSFGLAIGASRAPSAARQTFERCAAHPHGGPLILRDRSEAPIEADRWQVPVEHCPVEPCAAALERGACQPGEQPPADTVPAGPRAHEQILEVDSGLAEEGREVLEE